MISTIFFSIFLNLNIESIYTIYLQNGDYILKTNYIAPKEIKCINKDKIKIIKNLKNRNFFKFSKIKCKKIIPIFDLNVEEKLFKRVKEDIDSDIPYKILANFNKKKLIELYHIDKNINGDKILKILLLKNLEIEDISKRLDIDKKISLFKLLSLNKLKKYRYNTKIFSYLYHLDISDFYSNKDIPFLTKITIEALKQEKYYIVSKILTFNIDILKIFENIFKLKNSKLLEQFLDIFIDNIDNIKLKKREISIKNLNKFSINIIENYGYLYPYLEKKLNKTKLLSLFKTLNSIKRERFIIGLLKNLKFDYDIVILKFLLKYRSLNILLNFLKYGHYKNKYFDFLDSLLINYLVKSEKNNIYYKILTYSSNYLKNKHIYKIFFENYTYLIKAIEYKIENNFPDIFISKIIKNKIFKSKVNHSFREIGTIYSLKFNTIEIDKILNYIDKKLHVNRNIRYQTDERYISIILPIIAKKYPNKGERYYKKWFDTENLIMIQTLLKVIEITKDRSFLPILEKLKNDKEIRFLVLKVLSNFK